MEQETPWLFEVKNPNNLPLIDYRQIVELQNSEAGDLKDLSQEDYDKLKLSIEENGFFLPFFLWEHESQFFALDGHQRLRVLNNEDGQPYELPYLLVEADTLAEAKQKLLIITSQYGKMTDEGLKAFTHDLDQDWVNSRVTFQGLRPLNLSLKRDMLPPAETTEAPAETTAPAKPSASHDHYSVYETLMDHNEKLVLLNVINDIQRAIPHLETQGAVLHYMAAYYAERNPVV